MTIDNIVKNEGATLTKTLRKSTLRTGYMVSLSGYEKQVKTTRKTKLFFEIAKANAKAQNVKNSYVGIWIENGVAFIDISINIKDLDKAIQFGKNNEQLAIWDVKNETVIYL